MLLSVSEVSRILGTNKNYVYKLINAGLLPCLVIGSKKIRKESLDDFLEKYEGKNVDEILKGLEENV